MQGKQRIVLDVVSFPQCGRAKTCSKKSRIKNDSTAYALSSRTRREPRSGAAQIRDLFRRDPVSAQRHCMP
jgi:hypothetical protein